VVFVTSGCNACHAISGLSSGAVGPALDGLAARAGETVADLDAEEYIRQSIIDPSAHVVEGFADGLMPQTFGETLTQEQLDDLVAFLLTLE
jgi:mono/diheme cytochrome c family protein